MKLRMQRMSSRAFRRRHLAAAGALAAFLVAGLPGAFAQSPQAAPANVVQLSAMGSVEVPQDHLAITLAATRDAADAASVQGQLKAVLEAALARARGEVEPGQVDVQTGAFSLSPRYDRNGRINGWQGRSELLIQGRDFARVSALAAKVQDMVIGDVSFSLSREGREKVEQQAQAQAIERFKSRAGQIAQGFGFTRYSLREVSVNTDGGNGYMPRQRLVAASAPQLAADAAVPVEAGKATVTVTVSGAVQLQ